MEGKHLYAFTSLLVFYLCLLIHNAKSYEIGELGSWRNVRKAKHYLLKYGYLTQDTFSAATADTLSNRLKILQEFAGLEQTGKVDQATIRQMQIPRCGKPDLIDRTNRRYKRYQHQGSRWRKGQLTWRYDQNQQTRDLSREAVLRILRKAFAFWSAQTNLDFIEEQYNDKPDIWVKFIRQSHGDPYPFDGEGGTLAHAFYPGNNVGFDGDVHFDDAERFTEGTADGKNLLWVATHEIGHSIGLAHSRNKDAIMYPWYTGYKRNFHLKYDDIVGIQRIYGGRRNPVRTRAPTRAPTQPQPDCVDRMNSCGTWADGGYCNRVAYTTYMNRHCCRSCSGANRDLFPVATTAKTTTRRPATRPPANRRRVACPEAPISAMWYVPRYKVNALVTTENKVYLVNSRNGVPRYNRVVNLLRYMSGFTGFTTADAAFTTTGETFIFSGNKYSVFTGFLKKVSGPHSIHETRGPLNMKFPTWAKKIEAALVTHKTGKIYFFVKYFQTGYYFRYDMRTRSVDRNYPRSTASGWGGPKSGPDSAISRDGNTYFIVGRVEYKISESTFKADKGYPIGSQVIRCANVRRSEQLKVGTSIGKFIGGIFASLKKANGRKPNVGEAVVQP